VNFCFFRNISLWSLLFFAALFSGCKENPVEEKYTRVSKDTLVVQSLVEENPGSSSPVPTVIEEVAPSRPEESIPLLAEPGPESQPEEIESEAATSSRDEIVEDEADEDIQPLFFGIEGLEENLVEDPAPVPSNSPALNPDSDSGLCSGLEVKIPARSQEAKDGKMVAQELWSLGGSERDQKVLNEVFSGNIPDQLRHLVPVELTRSRSDGSHLRITICVSQDYLSVGKNDDHVRFPLGLPAAMRLLSSLDLFLPTVKMVDAIHQQAEIKLSPSTKDWNGPMESTRYILEHNDAIEQALGDRAGLVAGHKKDLVLSNRLLEKAGRVAIYGWHYTNGKPIQPLSIVHHENYADYSHGIRLVSRTAFLNDSPRPLIELLSDPEFSEVIFGEGVLNKSLVEGN